MPDHFAPPLSGSFRLTTDSSKQEGDEMHVVPNSRQSTRKDGPLEERDGYGPPPGPGMENVEDPTGMCGAAASAKKVKQHFVCTVECKTVFMDGVDVEYITYFVKQT